VLVDTGRELGLPVRDGGTVVVIQGPRFSTRAESDWYQQAGWHVINMTAYPEAYLARELELCYANVSMVADYDVGVPGVPPVSNEAVIAVFTANLEKLRALLFAVLPRIPAQPPEHLCATALRGARFHA
jgi:5'-methylthioadenosine phosphorylase